MASIRSLFFVFMLTIARSNHVNKLKTFKRVLISSVTSYIAATNLMVATADDEWNDRNRLAAEVWRKVDETYYDRTFGGQDWFALRQEVVKRSYDTDESTYKALQTMLQKIGDKYTRFLPPAQYNALMNSALGELVGIGVELELTSDNKVKIINLQPDSPASSSGLQIGDIIVNVDGSDATNLAPEEVAAILRGKEGTKASVRVQRSSSPSAAETQDYSIIRKPFKIQGVTSQVIDVKGKKIGIIKVRSFATSTEKDMAEAYGKLNKDNTLDSLVLDLRNNAGGLLEGAVETANLFMPPGKIVVFSVAKDGLPRALQTLPGIIDDSALTMNLPDLKTPLYILVNENTASAAEVLSAALKENGRATLIGRQTFGKGLIQTLEPLSQGGVAITTAKYETPLHNNINKIGLKVDKEIPCETNAPVDICISQAF